MESIKELVDNFCDTHNLERSIECEKGVVDNGAKSITSIMSKIRRLNRPNKSVCLSDFTDLTRCAVLVEDYSNILPLLVGMSHRVDNLNGHVSRQASGYIGIHLTSTVHNIPAEIQLSTKDVWLAKQASEFIYARHREFEKTRKVLYKKILRTSSETERNKLISEFRMMNASFVSDYSQTRDLYREIHKQTDFYDNIDEIEGMILALNIENRGENRVHYDYDKLLDEKVVLNGSINELKAIEIITAIKPILNREQSVLVDGIQEILDAKLNEELKPTDFERNIMGLRTGIEEYFRGEFPEGALVHYSDEYSNLIKNEINNSTILIGSQILNNNIKFESVQKNIPGTLYDIGIIPDEIKNDIDRTVKINRRIEEAMQSL